MASDVTWFCIKRDIRYLKFIIIDPTIFRSQKFIKRINVYCCDHDIKNCPHNPTHFVKLHDYLFATTEL